MRPFDPSRASKRMWSKLLMTYDFTGGGRFGPKTNVRWQFPERHQKLITERSVRVIYFPIDDALARLGAKAILSNVLLAAFLWSMFDQDVDALKSLVGEKFAKKKDLLELNMRCIDEGYSFVDPGAMKRR
jgi:Pyruvate/2-oxoacid:ferredoxin oxidoreductase gamma subunit